LQIFSSKKGIERVITVAYLCGQSRVPPMFQHHNGWIYNPL